MSNLWLVLIFAISFVVHIENGASIDYKSALTKCILFYEAQRSGKLPSNQRIQWRGDSGLNDGKNDGIDLVGGYYDAGDNVKFGLPLGFTITMLSWSVVEFGPQLQAQNELKNALRAIKWGTDYLIKAHPEANVLYGEVGDGGSDHACWMRPEEMTTPRTAYKIDEHNPGADLAGETAAALAAAAAVAFKDTSPRYAAELLEHAKQLFEFGRQHTGQYSSSIPVAGQFYSSSGYEDELLWAAAWLKRATEDDKYLEFINSTNTGGTRQTFSWDDKYVGAQLLVAQEIIQGKIPNTGKFNELKNNAEQFICNCIQRGNNNIRTTNAGLLWFLEWSNLQYVTTASFTLAAYARTLSTTRSTLQCPAGPAGPEDLTRFARTQADYILGSNPNSMSYMVGFGSNYPKQVHHRGASIVSIKTNPNPVGCTEGFNEWFHKNADNPNVLDGAIVGGPDQGDQYRDSRDNFQQAEPAIANNAPFVGVLASLAGGSVLDKYVD